jgi:hypothetical protein
VAVVAVGLIIPALAQVVQVAVAQVVQMAALELLELPTEVVAVVVVVVLVVLQELVGLVLLLFLIQTVTNSLQPLALTLKQLLVVTTSLPSQVLAPSHSNLFQRSNLKWHISQKSSTAR